jgi:hypothetical protein
VPDAPPLPALSDEQLAKLQQVLETYGKDTVDALLNAGHLFYGIRKAGSMAIRHSADYYEIDRPHTVVFQMDPNAKRLGERVEITTISGPLQLAFPFGN